MTERKHDSVAKAVSSIPRNSKGVPLYGAEAMREGWDTKANPWHPDCPEFSKWLSDWWGENANRFVSEEEVAEAANARLVAWATTGVLDTPAPGDHPDGGTQMTERKYSISEIDKMRGAVRLKLQPGPMQPYNDAELSARVEDQLRTYMMAGVDPDELVKDACGWLSDGSLVTGNIVVTNNRWGAGINQPTADKPSKGQ